MQTRPRVLQLLHSGLAPRRGRLVHVHPHREEVKEGAAGSIRGIRGERERRRREREKRETRPYFEPKKSKPKAIKYISPALFQATESLLGSFVSSGTLPELPHGETILFSVLCAHLAVLYRKKKKKAKVGVVFSPFSLPV